MDIMWNYLALDLVLEQGLLKGRNTARNLHDIWRRGQAVTYVVNSRIISYAALWDTSHPTWFELGSMWVHPHYRGHKIATNLFLECILKCKSKLGKDAGMFIVTNNPQMLHLAKEVGFREAKEEKTRLFLPQKKTCIPGDYLPISPKRLCSMYKRSKHVLFFI